MADDHDADCAGGICLELNLAPSGSWIRILVSGLPSTVTSEDPRAGSPQPRIPTRSCAKCQKNAGLWTALKAQGVQKTFVLDCIL
jgi:hypothetical protein